MNNIFLNFSSQSKKKKANVNSKKEKVYLNYYPDEPEIPERYTYIDNNGIEQIFDDSSYFIQKTSATKCEAQKVIIEKIPLTFVPSKPEIKYQPAHFTYVSNDCSKIFLGDPIYHKDTNSYTGILKLNNIIDEEVEIYEY